MFGAWEIHLKKKNPKYLKYVFILHISPVTLWRRKLHLKISFSLHYCFIYLIDNVYSKKYTL